MDYFDLVLEKIFAFEHLGLKKMNNGAVIIGAAPHVAPEAYNHKIFKPLEKEDIDFLENENKTTLPKDYIEFLTTKSNGLRFFVTCFSLYGLRKQIGRDDEAMAQPFSLSDTNVWEKPKNAKPEYFFIGGYGYDGSKLYIDKITNKVHYCARRDTTSLKEWNNFEEMMISETERIFKLFDDKGVRLVTSKETLPI